MLNAAVKGKLPKDIQEIFEVLELNVTDEKQYTSISEETVIDLLQWLGWNGERMNDSMKVI